MKILVTGGAGFIGSHVVDALLIKRHTVVVLDDLSSGKRSQVHSKAILIKGSVTNRTLLTKLFSREKFKTIIHLAAQKNARYSIDDPVFDAKQNIIGTIELLEQARTHRVKRFIFSSTGGVMYGDASVVPTPESYVPQPTSPYAISKRSAEYYLDYYAKVYGISTIALRLANIYGPRQDPKGEAGVVAIFSSLLLQGKQPGIFGSGKQTRDYLSVFDAVRAVSCAIDKPVQGIYNIGTGKQTSVIELYNLLLAVHGKTVRPKYLPAIPGEQQISALQAKKALKDLDWKPSIALNKGLIDTYNWFKQQVK